MKLIPNKAPDRHYHYETFFPNTFGFRRYKLSRSPLKKRNRGGMFALGQAACLH